MANAVHFAPLCPVRMLVRDCRHVGVPHEPVSRLLQRQVRQGSILRIQVLPDGVPECAVHQREVSLGHDFGKGVQNS